LREWQGRTERRIGVAIKRNAAYQSAMSETPPPELPDRLSTDPKSPYHNAELLERGVGIRFNGIDRNNVEEYCVSEGWVRLAVGKTVDRHGNAMTVKYKGVVEPYLRVSE
jgi:hypothetical protein